MNAIYRSVYNESLGAWVAVPEFTAAKGKKNSVKVSTSTRSQARFMLSSLAMGVALV